MARRPLNSLLPCSLLTALNAYAQAARPTVCTLHRFDGFAEGGTSTYKQSISKHYGGNKEIRLLAFASRFLSAQFS